MKTGSIPPAIRQQVEEQKRRNALPPTPVAPGSHVYHASGSLPKDGENCVGLFAPGLVTDRQNGSHIAA